MILCGVYDKKADFDNYFAVFNNRAEAVRSFTLACRDKDSMLSKFPEDYDLYFLADVDERTGYVDYNETSLLMSASDVVDKQQ